MVNACFYGGRMIRTTSALLREANLSLSVGHVIVSVTAEDCQYNNMTFKRFDVDRIDYTIVSIERYLYKSERALHIKMDPRYNSISIRSL